MHFSIPDVQEFTNESGTTYTGYVIHINGFFHCTLRYKQLFSLHEQLQANHPYDRLPQFPPKKFLPLSQSQIEERRVQLEKYIQIVGQNPTIAHSDLLIAFLKAAQQETHNISTHEVNIQVSLMNGYRIPLNVSSTDNSDAILDVACSNINLPKELMKYFSLYLFNWSCAKNGQPCMKKLESYESPYISCKYVRPEDNIVLRKNYWDPCYDIDLMIDRVSLDLLYLQIISEIDLGWLIIDDIVRERLTLYESSKQKREYVELARSLKHYGRIPAGVALVEGSNIIGTFNEDICRLNISLTCKELILSSNSKPCKEERFKVTRMRCWRITTLHQLEKRHTNGYESLMNTFVEPNKNLELSFEYLMSKDHLRWITLKTEHATYISVCLQSIVDELMQQKNIEQPYRPVIKRCNLTYIRRDGSSRLVTPSSSTDTLSSGNTESATIGGTSEIFSIQKLAEKFASVAFKSGKDCVENDAFDDTVDEDL